MSLFVVSLDWEEVVAMPYGLDENERAVEHKRYKPGKNELRRAVKWAEVTCRIIWKNQRETGECGQHCQGGARSLDLKSLFVVTGTSPEQTRADNTITNDHDGGENRVAC